MQNNMLKRSLGVVRSSPTHSVYALAGELPSKYRAKILTAREIMKNMFQNRYLYEIIADNPLVKSSYSVVFHEFADIFNNIKVVPFSRQDNLVIRYNLLPASKQNVSKEAVHAIYNCEIEYYKNNNYGIFATDASPGDFMTGCGIYNVVQGHRFLFQLNIKSSSMFGELFALRKALEIAAEDGYSRCVLFTDSLAACKALGAVESDNWLVAEFHDILCSSTINSCHVVWTPCHMGIQLNEEADYLAKQAVAVGAPVVVKFTPEEAMAKIKDRVMSSWNNEFIEVSQEKGRHFFQICDNVFKKPWFVRSRFEPKETKLINRLMIGHTYDKVYLHRIGSADTPMCEPKFVPGFILVAVPLPLDYIRTIYCMLFFFVAEVLGRKKLFLFLLF
ncbi:uncharacterized protein isoform X2 [Musca autumnalis]|uniref:uncharacterized protein isoform X2 n=1 Tax=Musca autumnalis TaxID=221902 RepID=UPI003CE8C1A8